MIKIPLSSEQRAQLIGWANREKDHLLSIVAMSERIIITRVTGSLDAARNDLNFLTNLRSSAHGDGPLELTLADIDILRDVASANRFPNRVRFWGELQESITQALDDSNQQGLFDEIES